jgi:hypothetical protein
MPDYSALADQRARSAAGLQRVPLNPFQMRKKSAAQSKNFLRDDCVRDLMPI